MQFLKESPSQIDLLIGNLKLLNYDIKEANQIFRTQFVYLNPDLLQNPKLQVHLTYFLMQKTHDDLPQFTYPPRTQLEQTTFKSQVAAYLKNSTRIPKNYAISLASLEYPKILSFFRFMSEFAVRLEFFKLFPTKQLKTFYPDPARLDEKTSANELNDLYCPASYQFDENNAKLLQIPPQILKILIGQCGHRIMCQQEKLYKVITINYNFQESMTEIVNLVSESFKKEREKQLQLNMQIQNMKNQLPAAYLSQERKLDRKPIIDMSEKVFNGIENVVRQFYELKLDQKLNIQSTPRLDRFGVENNLNTLQQKYNDTLDIDAQIQEISDQPNIRDRIDKVLENSRITIQNLRDLKDRLLKQ